MLACLYGGEYGEGAFQWCLPRYGIGGFLKVSHELLVMWSPEYLSRISAVAADVGFPDFKIFF